MGTTITLDISSLVIVVGTGERSMYAQGSNLFFIYYFNILFKNLLLLYIKL